MEIDWDDSTVETSFLRSKLSINDRKVFFFPKKEDSCSHTVEDMELMKLPFPTTGSHTGRLIIKSVFVLFVKENIL